MFTIVEGKSAKRQLQEILKKSVTDCLEYKGTRNIGFPSGNFNGELYSSGNGQIWAVFNEIVDGTTPRFWNGFGFFDPSKNAQTITVEINIPTGDNTVRVASFFAKDTDSNEIYLMHDGSIGGGKAGVGRVAFLAWSKSVIEDVQLSDGSTRSGIIIGRINSKDIANRISRFATIVRAFKEAVRLGQLNQSDFQETLREWEKFNRETSGRRKGRRNSVIDYVSYHGDVVNMLHDERKNELRKNERIFNNKLIDLFVKLDDSIIEIYEIKTSTDRQAIYTGIGQLFAHSSDSSKNLRRILVLPEGQIQTDLEAALISLSIEIRRYNIVFGDKTKINLL